MMFKNPKYLWRTDGARFTRSDEDGTYAMDESEMGQPYRHLFNVLMNTGKFSDKCPPLARHKSLKTCKSLNDAVWLVHDDQIQSSSSLSLLRSILTEDGRGSRFKLNVLREIERRIQNGETFSDILS
jgi:hypothetical protein